MLRHTDMLEGMLDDVKLQMQKDTAPVKEAVPVLPPISAIFVTLSKVTFVTEDLKITSV